MMTASKRQRSKKSGRGPQMAARDDFTMEHINDSGVIYGKSLPIQRLNKLIDSEILVVDFDEPSEEASYLGKLIDNLKLFATRLTRRKVEKEYLNLPENKRFYRTNFNAYWSDYEYGPPAEVTVVGRGALGCLDRNHPVVDVSFKLPKATFNPRDYINYRYINKRNAWMCCFYEDVISSISKGRNSELLKGIPNATIKAELTYREPKVNVELSLDVDKRTYKVRMLTHLDEATFKKVSLSPSRNNVRIPTTLKPPVELDEHLAESNLQPTPTYNSGILEDLLRESINAKVKRYFDKYAKLKGALALLSIWARTQGLGLVSVDLSAGDDGSQSKGRPTLINQDDASSSKGSTRKSSTSSKRSRKSGRNDVEQLDDSIGDNKHDNAGEKNVTDCSCLDTYNNHAGRSPEMVYDNGISGFLWSILLCHLAECNKFPPDIEAFPLFMATIRFLSTMDINRFAYVFGVSVPRAKIDAELISDDITGDIESEERVKKRKVHFQDANASKIEANVSLPQFFIDSDMSLNVLYKTVFTFQEVIDRAKATLKAASDMSSPFLFSQMFDIPYNIHCHHDVKLVFKGCVVDSWFNTWELRRSEYMAARLTFILNFGLKDRLHHLYFRMNNDGDLLALIGLDDTIQRTTDVGPLTNSEECLFFREFWGHFAETRSFNDGTISECLLWKGLESIPGSLAPGSHSLAHISGPNFNVRILNILLQYQFQKFQLIPINKWNSGDSLITVTRMTSTDGVIYMELPMVECNHRIATDYRTKLMNAYNKLNELLRSLDSLPLKVSNIFICDSAFGYADTGLSRKRHKLLIELESSTKWPDNEKAIRGVKVALSIAILKGLYRESEIKSRIAENGDMEVQIMGVKFTMVVVCNKETQPVISAIREFDPNHSKKVPDVDLDKVRDYYRSLQVDRCKVVALKIPSFTTSTQLSKAFCSSCKLPDYEFIGEMLNCYIFDSKEFMLPSPQSGNAGFMRFLYLVSHYDWAMHPILLDTDKTGHEMLELKKPSVVPYMWISVPEDPYCLVPKMPSTALSKRFIGQCQRYLNKVESYFMKTTNFGTFFEVEHSGYNMVLELENPYDKLKYSAKRESVKLSLDEATYILDTFVASLKKTYEGLLEVAYDEMELHSIHKNASMRVFLKFNPLACIPSTVPKPQWAQQMVVCNDTTLFIPNIPAILNGIRQRGEGLLKSINVL